MSTDSYIQVSPDSTGKKMATQQVVRSDGTTTVEIEEVESQGKVSDTPESYSDGDLKPLSLNPQGRLRVATYPSDDLSAWEGLDGNPWGMENPYLGKENPYV